MILVFATLAAAPGPPPRPPDGTYTYSIAGKNGKSVSTTIVVESTSTLVNTSERTDLPGGSSVVVRVSYDTATLLPTHYELHQHSGLVNTDLAASVTPTGAAFQGVPLAFKALDGTKFMLVGEGLGAYRLMMPFVARENDAPFTFAALNGNQTLSAKPVAVTQARPHNAGVQDASYAVQVGTDTLTSWYDPHTLVPDEIDSTEGVTMHLTAYSEHVTKIVEAQATAHAPLAFAHYTDTDIIVPSSGGAVLSGTLSVPDGESLRHPAIVFVHGSGPGTRLGGTPANPTFLLLANRLANQGIVVLRYDKRGIGKSTGTATEDWHPLADDLRAMVAYLKHSPDVDPNRIFVVGHSEGGLIVPLAANSLHVRGLVLMAAPAIPLHDVLVKQGVEKMPAAQQKMIAEAFAAYDNIDPAKVIRTVTTPVLMLQGGKDSQVLASDMPRLTAAARTGRRSVRTVLLPEDDHLFIRLPASQRMEGNEIVEPNPIDPRVASQILEFVKTH